MCQNISFFLPFPIYQVPGTTFVFCWGGGANDSLEALGVMASWPPESARVGHLMSPGQVKWLSLPKKVCDATAATVFEGLIWNFHNIIRLSVTTKRVFRIFDFGDLMPGQFCDLPIRYKAMRENLNHSSTHQIGLFYHELAYIRLLLLTQVKILFGDHKIDTF